MAELWRFERASYFVDVLCAEPEVVERRGLALWIDEKKIFPMSRLSTPWDRRCGVWSVEKFYILQRMQNFAHKMADRCFYQKVGGSGCDPDVFKSGYHQCG